MDSITPTGAPAPAVPSPLPEPSLVQGRRVAVALPMLAYYAEACIGAELAKPEPNDFLVMILSDTVRLTRAYHDLQTQREGTFYDS